MTTQEVATEFRAAWLAKERDALDACCELRRYESLLSDVLGTDSAAPSLARVRTLLARLDPNGVTAS